MNHSCSFFSHGIVAFNGWPLNALRPDNNCKKGELDPSAKTRRKKPHFSEKTGHRLEGRFSIPRKPRKTPVCILWKNSPPIRENAEKRPLFDAAIIGRVEESNE
jgi:hypothetical protein